MENEWPIHELSEFINIKHGFAFKGEYFKDVRTPDVLITPGNFSIGGGFKADKLKYYDGPVPADYILHEGDLVVTMTDLSKQADTLGFSALIPSLDGHRILHNQRVGLVELINDELDPIFLYYLLQSREYRHHVISGATGTTVKHTSPTKIVSFSFRKPPKNIQILIGKHLMAIEAREKINTGLNQTLEQMAQALFKSWFVDFDPVIDNALAAGNDIPDALQNKAEQRLQAQQLPDFKALPDDIRALFPSEFEQTNEPSIGIAGWIPKGWKVKTIGSLNKINSESWTKKNAPESVKYVDLANAKNGTILDTVDYTFEEAPSRARRVLRQHDTIIGLVRPANRSFAYVNKNGLTGSTGFAVVRALNESYRAFTYLTLTNDDSITEFARIADGAAYPAIKPEDVTNALCIYSSDEILKKFEEFAGKFLLKKAANEKQLPPLTEIRDSLLPKLISGELQLQE